ncbi:MAG: HAD-IIIA family hydrolase [Deltaproteobacteria bacterium]|nr:HAD-IIIA family hydrolase [Deltaproteobacteria bacterium]
MQAVVLAGGKGTRLGADMPKPLVPVNGVPMIDHVLGWLGREGVTDIVLCTAFQHEKFAAHLGVGRTRGLEIRTSIETEPLGTAGAVKKAAALLDDEFLVVYADVLADVSVLELLRAHRANAAWATLVVHPNNHPFDSDRVIADARGRVLKMVRKEDQAGADAGALCSAALYVCSKRVLGEIPDDAVPRDFAREVFPDLARRGLPLFAYRTGEYLKDMGTTARRAQVERDLARGIPRSMRRSAERPAVLLDRDGVLIEDVPFLSDAAQLEIVPGTAAALRRLNEAHVIAACVTNQPVIARGEVTEDGLADIHRRMEGLLGADGAWLDELFVCPHHTERGFLGERPELKVACTCRKPLPGLLHQAEASLGVARRSSIVVGDRSTDLLCARLGGYLGVGVRTGSACRDGKHLVPPETPIVADVAQAVAFMLDTAPSWDALLAGRAAASGTSAVVLVGGPSRAGKTVAASALALRFESQGRRTLRLSLDRFIQPANERRSESTVAERTSFAQAEAAVRALAAGTAIEVPGYDPLTRERAPTEVLQRSGEVLIIDGVLACALDVPGALKVWLGADPVALRARRLDFYRWKGLTGAALDEAVDGRAEESDAVAATRARADLSLTFDDSLRLKVLA